MSSYGIVDSLFYVCCVVCEAGVVVVVVVDVEGAMVSRLFHNRWIQQYVSDQRGKNV